MSKSLIFNILCLGIILLPGITFAQANTEINYLPLVDLPFSGSKLTFQDYLSFLYTFSISVAAFLAVIKIIFAGVKYMLTDIITVKGQAKTDIQNALLGLIIIIAAVLILETINPELKNFDIFDNNDFAINILIDPVLSEEKNPCLQRNKDGGCIVSKNDIKKDASQNLTKNSKEAERDFVKGFEITTEDFKKAMKEDPNNGVKNILKSVDERAKEIGTKSCGDRGVKVIKPVNFIGSYRVYCD